MWTVLFGHFFHLQNRQCYTSIIEYGSTIYIGIVMVMFSIIVVQIEISHYTTHTLINTHNCKDNYNNEVTRWLRIHCMWRW